MKAQQEGVILVYESLEGIEESDTPTVMIRKNGSVQYYKLTEMSFGDHAEWLGADKPQ